MNSGAGHLALSRRFGNFASLRFDPSGQSQVVFRSVGPVQVAGQSARAPPHSVRAGTPQAEARSQAGAPSAVCSSPMDLSAGAPPPQNPWSSGLDGGPSSSRQEPLHRHPPALIRFPSQGDVGAQTRLADTRRGHGPPVFQPSWTDQVEYEDRLDTLGPTLGQAPGSP